MPPAMVPQEFNGERIKSYFCRRHTQERNGHRTTLIWVIYCAFYSEFRTHKFIAERSLKAEGKNVSTFGALILELRTS